MIRSTLAAVLASATGALAIRPTELACADALFPHPEVAALGLVSAATGLLWLLVMTCREPGRRDGSPMRSPFISHEPHRYQPRDAAGRFKGR